MLRPPFVCIAVLLLLPSLSVQALADPAAILASAEGEVEVVGPRGAQRANFGLALEPGDVVRVGRGGAATVVFGDGHVARVPAGGSLTVEARGSEAAGADAQAVPAEVFAQVSKYVTAGSRQKGLVALSALRSGGNAEALPMILGPRMTEVLDDRPAFRWRPTAGARRYRVVLSGEEGELWSREIGDTSLAFPADAEPLAGPGDYVWRLEAWSEQGRLRGEETMFHVPDAGRRELVRAGLARIGAGAGGPETPATHFLCGSYLYASGVLGEAAAHFEALSRLAPDSAAPHEALGNAYRAMGLMDLAASAFETALALSR
jgi:prepilin-type processing-associated H-X9-DG protein